MQAKRRFECAITPKTPTSVTIRYDGIAIFQFRRFRTIRLESAYSSSEFRPSSEALVWNVLAILTRAKTVF